MLNTTTTVDFFNSSWVNAMCNITKTELAHAAQVKVNQWFVLGALAGAIIVLVIIILVDKDFRRKWITSQ